jgi:hypothetical protein
MQRIVDQALDALVKELGFTGRDFGVAIHGNRIIAGLVFKHLHMKDYQDPQANFDTLLDGSAISDATNLYFTRVRDAVNEHYSNAIIPTLFKNQTKCKDLFAACGGSNGTND